MRETAASRVHGVHREGEVEHYSFCVDGRTHAVTHRENDSFTPLSRIEHVQEIVWSKPEPFEIAPDPYFLFPTERYNEALQRFFTESVGARALW